MPRLSLVILILLMPLLLLGCGKKASEGTEAPSKSAPQTDEEVAKELDDLFNDGQGARAYLKKDNSQFVGISKDSMKEIVEDLYSAGATKIMVVDAASEEGEEFASSLMIELPKTDAARKKVLSVYNEWLDQMGKPKKEDEGGKYLILITDPDPEPKG